MNAPAATTVHDFIELFKAAQLAQGNSRRTVLWYEEALTRFFSWLQAKDLHRGDWLCPEVIERYLSDAKAQGNAPATVAGKYRALRGFFAWLERREYIKASPMLQMSPPKIPKKAPRRAGVDEFQRLLDTIPCDTWLGLRDRLIIHVLFLCGLRRDEVAQLTPDDFLLAQHLLHVRAGKTGARFVPMLSSVERAFVAYLYARPAHPSPRLLLGADGGQNPLRPLTGNGIYQMLRRRCLAADLPRINPHGFRHGLAMYMLNEGGDMSLVQKVLGHAQISTTAKHYAEWLTDGMQRQFFANMGSLTNR